MKKKESSTVIVFKFILQGLLQVLIAYGLVLSAAYASVFVLSDAFNVYLIGYLPDSFPSLVMVLFAIWYIAYMVYDLYIVLSKDKFGNPEKDVGEMLSKEDKK